MGIYQYTDPQTGRSYNFEHAGDAPTNEDFAFISNFLQQERAGYAEKYQDVFGRELEAPDDGTAIGRGFTRGKQQIKQAFGETLGTIGEEAGLGFLSQYGQGVEESARQRLGELQLEQPERMQSTDVEGFGSALTYAGEVIGEQIPQLGLGLGAAVAAPIAAGATGVAAPFLIGAGAAGAITAPILFGNNIQRQEDEVAAGKKSKVDVGAALTATFGQAALEGISDRLLLGGVFRPLGKSLFTRTATRAAGGATTEGLTEVGQQIMERAQAGLPIDSDDAIAEYREAAIAGGLIGGGVRATGLGEGRTAPPTTPTTDTTPPEAAPAPETEPEAAPEAAPEVEPEQLELGLEDPLLRPELREDQEQGELFTTAAQLTEARNAADPAPLEGAAQRTEEERAAAAAQVAVDTATPSAALASEEANLQAEVARKEQKAAEKAAAKTQEFLPETAAQPDRAAALESEQTGEQIEVGAAPETAVAPTTEVTKEMLDSIGVFGRAPLRKRIIGKNLTDPEVQGELRKYAKNSNIRKKVPDLEGRVETLLGGLDVGTSRPAGLRVEPTTTGIGAGVPSGAGSVGGVGEQLGAVGDTPAPTAPDELPVGGGVSSAGVPDVATREQPDTLEAGRTELPPFEGTLPPGNYSDATAKPVRTPQEQAPTTPAMQQAAVGVGRELGTAGQVIPAPVPPAPRVAPVQAAPVPQADLQAVEAQRDTAAQAQIEQVFEGNRGKQPEVREYHDTQLDPRSAPEVTTAVDKEGVVELLNTKDADLDAQGKAAKLYFKRFRRPVDALAEIGATVVVGPTQTIEKDYVQVQTFDEAGRKKGRAPQLAFYKGMTQKSAMDARRWVHANMSDGAIQEMIRARRVANRDTSKYSPSDAYIGVTKAAKSIQQKEDNALKNQLNRYLASPEVNFKEPADLDQSLRTEATGQLVGERTAGPVTKSFKPIKDQTAFESYLASIDFKRRKVRSNETVADDTYTYTDKDKNVYAYEDTRNENQLLTKAEAQEFYDGLTYSQNELGFLLIDPVHGLDTALLPSVRNAVQRGDLQFALNAIASTNQVDRIRQIAGKLAENVGTTQVQVVDDLSQMTGRTAAGLFEPETNTIFIDANNGMNVHTILHEMTHAATSASLANPSLPEVKQLQTVFNAVREQLGEVYGTANLDEFVAEAFSNPEFQSALALTKVDGGKMSGWEKFTGAVRRIVRKLLGMQPKGPESALDEVDRIINGMLTPSPATRAAPSMMLMAGTKAGANRLAQGAANLAPETSGKIADLSDVVLNEGVAPAAKSVVLNTLPVNILTEISAKKIPFAETLNTLIKQQSGALRKKSDVLDSILRNLHAWQRKNKESAKILNNIIPRSTYLKVDPSRTDGKYMKTIRDDKERSAEYDELRAEYLKMDKQGQDFYKQMRNYFQDTYDDIVSALESRLEATVPDADARKSAFEQLRKVLEKDSGVIRPYFPLLRRGKYRLSYMARDPESGRPERFVEYYPTLRKAEQARETVLSLGGDIEPDVELTESSQTMNFDKVPSTGFIRDILQSVQFSKERFANDEAYRKTMQELVDLSLDAMPERSFMQNLRRRKGVRGFIGDVTPTGMGGMEFDAFTMLKEKGRDLNRQLVQMKSAAEIEKFRKDLAPYKTDPSTAMEANKLDRIATFAQSPNVPQYSQVVNSLGFGFTMGLNFSSAAITFFDVAMSAMPVLAGTHGVQNTSRAFGSATKLFAGSPNKRTVMMKGPDGNPVAQEVDMGMAGKSIANYDFSNLPQALQDIRADILISMGVDQGQFNQSMVQEDLEVGRGAPLETVNKYSSFMFHHSERFNRETTLTAAYMLEVEKMQRAKGQLSDQDYRDAAQEAINQTEFTLGSTAAAGRPIVAQSGIGNILFLFKRFAISKYYMMAKLAKDAANNPDPEVRKAARAGGRNFLISTGLFAGMGGMPLMGAIGAIYDLFTDDDEDDFESAMRQYVGEGVYGGLANEILGVDLANRISMNSLLYRAPIIDKDQSNLWTLIEQLGGPVIGVGLSVERGIKEVAEGEVYRGVEAMVPAAIRNGMKAFRFATEGAETRRGDAITEDINPYNAVMQGLGFAPQAYIQQLEANKNARRRSDAIGSRRTKLLRRRNMAIREGDMDELAKVERLIEEYNAGLPQDVDTRKRVITPETKERSLKTFERTTSNMRGGITTTELERSILDQYDF